MTNDHNTRAMTGANIGLCDIAPPTSGPARSRSARARPRRGRPRLAIARQEALEARSERGLDLGLALEPRQQHGGRLDGREAVAARLAPQPAVARGALGPKHDTLAFEHPGIAPPQRLGLAPGAVEQDDALDLA